MKRILVLTVLMAVLTIPSMLFAADKVTVGDIEVTNGMVTVPIVVSNVDGLMAMDLPLKFSEGVILKEVTYDGTRASYFDLKLADIDNDHNTVAIGLITQITASPKSDLDKGEGVIANLVFEIVDENLTEISIETITMTKPDHELMFIYQVREGDQVVGQDVQYPEFESVTVSLNSNVVDVLPFEYGLAQNYPNPFNPTTTITFSLANPGEYQMSIFNVLGQKVKEYSGYGEAGEVSIEFEGSQFSSGVYFYKLTAGDFTETKKMIMVK